MCGVLVEGGEREREGEKVGRGLKGKEEKKKRRRMEVEELG